MRLNLRLGASVLPVAALILAGCTRNNVALFVSIDTGGSFTASSTLNTEESLDGSTILALASHPERPEVVFASVQEQGIVVSRDTGQTWNSSGLTTGSPTDLVLHPQSPVTIFAASGQNVIRSTDDGASFATVYADPNTVTSISIDPAAPNNVWLGTDQGSLVHSENAGTSWQVVRQFERAITDILISPLGSAIIVGTAGDGLQISADRGKTFELRTPQVITGPSGFTADEIVAIAQATQVGSPLMVATTDGLFSSTSLGQEWRELPNPVAQAGTLSGLAASTSPGESILVAVAGNTIATSIDGGTTWTSRDVPTTRPLGAATVAGGTILVGVTGEGKGFIERTLQQ